MPREAISTVQSPRVHHKLGDRPLALRPTTHWKALRQGLLRVESAPRSVPSAQQSRQVQRLQRRLRGAHLDNIMGLMAAVEAKEPHAEQHSYHVAAYTERLGKVLNLSQSELEVIMIAALLHDVGKIGIPDAILTKPGLLTVEEYEKIKQHPTIGETIIKPIGFLERARPYVRHHHEWFDGHGYPDGLSGEQIPLGARVLQVADSIDAMVTPRSYKSGRCAEEVIAELVRCRGTQFDPIISDIAVDWLRHSPHELLSPTSIPRDLLSHASL